jgi:hypothetical protein
MNRIGLAGLFSNNSETASLRRLLTFCLSVEVEKGINDFDFRRLLTFCFSVQGKNELMILVSDQKIRKALLT